MTNRPGLSQIDEFMTRIGRQRGMSLTTGFNVEFDFPATSKFPADRYKKDKDIIDMLCDEAQLPNVQSATGQISGRYLGEQTVQYPHSRMFTDVGLGFLCDGDMLPLKFLHDWYNFIYSEGSPLVSMDDYEISQLAYHLERKVCGFEGGKQDQYSATFGGFNFIEFQFNFNIFK